MFKTDRKLAFGLIAALAVAGFAFGSGAARAADDAVSEEAAQGHETIFDLIAEGYSNVSDQLADADGADAGDDANDPLEPMNRMMFNFNEMIQTWFLRPGATMYKSFLPPEGQDVIGNMLSNISTPVVLANDLFQAEWDRAWQTTERFAINTTYGVGGMFDMAEDMGIPGHKEDFGQTMAVWGVDEGLYLVLPVIGPSNPRDAVGEYVVDSFLDPMGIWLGNTNRVAEKWSRTTVSGVERYSGVVDELEQVKKTSVDYYAAIRSMYRQKRMAEIRNSSESDLPPIPELSYEFDDEFSDENVGELPAGKSQ